MKPYRLFTLPFLAAVATLGATAHAAEHTSPVAHLDQALINAFECRSVASNIDEALKARHINTDGSTHTTLQPSITVFGHRVSDVTVFRQGSEDIYTTYLSLTAAQQESLKRSTGTSFTSKAVNNELTVTTGPHGQTVVQCTIATSPASDEGAVNNDWQQHLVTISGAGISVH